LRYISVWGRGDEQLMPRIIVYSSVCCPYCVRALALLRSKGARFEVIDVTMRPQLRAEMRERAGGINTVPQIFIGERHVGGCDELHELEEAGSLDPMLAE
jgi:glutaredoxin 3